ncbi:acyl-CoA dehydrogenase, putative [Talaromyces stipitatus ATCC 10500]|uniref:Acyl-CoA dehydrogenase, putative n=1 Tax=Talaromyces stipitatus (strain ATCC 10500 / CBS 375.48 / QM 6759 / NRRL 1006) TaxID=441959 RepID=B8M8F2_TALSN|nr:acyl-CoA dehydrogenase, putative [Talaromyces stipitatus ATCC 10500]EED20465.1 acyl-CoA dehydrogenase, putative [Talaromyces stipitatus ATCC 10500]
MEPSSSTKGFFQLKPTIPPQYLEDRALLRIISLYLPTPLPSTISSDLLRFSKLVLSKPVLGYIADAEKNLPYLKPLTSFGEENRDDPLVTSEGWRRLQEIGIEEGIVALAYEKNSNGEKAGWNPRIHQFVKYHIWSGSSAIVTCPSAMTDGAAKLLGKHLHDDPETNEIFAHARERLISRQNGFAWTSGQWMTERKGGSDVRGTETIAVKLNDATDGYDTNGQPLGPWRIDGFKWFSSATDANMTILLAKTGGGSDRKDSQISAFYAPLRRRANGSDENQTELNGIRIQRLKNKLGMRGYLIGKEGQGVKEISHILNITRMQNIISAVGAYGRGLAISRAFARVRSVSGKLLSDVSAHVRGLAQEHVNYTAHMHLSYFIAALLGRSEGFEPGDDTSAATSSGILPKTMEEINALYRLLTPIAKAQTALSAISGLRSCMESLGGVGYLENEDPDLNIARLFRDANVLAIWEGTTDVMADDFVRVVKRGKDGMKILAVFEGWVGNSLRVAEGAGLKAEAAKLKNTAERVLMDLRGKEKEELAWRGREYLRDLDWLVCGCLLIHDAVRDGDGVAGEVMMRWIHGGTSRDWREESVWDRKIVFGDEVVSAKL